MAFKFAILAIFVVAANAGGPASYDIGTLSADHSSIGYSQESTQKGYAGQNVVSTYSRAEDSAHSSVRVSNSHASNDLLAHHTVDYAAPAVIAKTYAAPTLAKPLIAPIAQPVIAPVKAAYGYAAPAAYASPLLTKTYAAYAAPAPAPFIAKTAYASVAPAPILAKAPIAGLAPAISYAAHPAPVLAKTYAAPYSYETAAPIVHVAFNGLGTSYAW